MDINTIIQDLLIKNNKVVIPGLGTFSLKYTPAEVYQYSHRVTPPSYQLIFSENIDFSDNSLVNAYAKEFKESPDGAKNEINNWVGNINSTLNKGVPFQMEELGTLKKENNKINFEADKNSVLFADFYGLEAIKMPLIEIEGEIIKNSQTAKPLYVPVRAKKFNRVNAVLIAVIVVFAGIGIYLLYQLGYLQAGYNKIAAIFSSEKAKQIQYATNDTLNGKIDANTLKRNALKYNETQKATEKEQNLQSKQEQKIIRYYLIAGSFKQMNRAEILKSELLGKGFTPEILVMNDSTYRVSLASYLVRRQAVDEYIKLTSGEYNNKLWLFSQLTEQ